MRDRRVEDIVSFYDALQRLEARTGKRRLAECHGRLDWPQRGVYFFFEPGELRLGSGPGPRVVRVGTHALAEGASSSLWRRLSQHRGTGAGKGNHRGSIFRLLVGEAMLARESRLLPSWGLGRTIREAAARLHRPVEKVRAEEAGLEAAVSQHIGAMEFLWLDVADEAGPESERGTIERNSIALLSDFDRVPVDAPSLGWLGRFSGRALVRQSGLWNSNHVRESYDPSFLRLIH